MNESESQLRQIKWLLVYIAAVLTFLTTVVASLVPGLGPLVYTGVTLLAGCAGIIFALYLGLLCMESIVNKKLGNSEWLRREYEQLKTFTEETEGAASGSSGEKR